MDVRVSSGPFQCVRMLCSARVYNGHSGVCACLDVVESVDAEQHFFASELSSQVVHVLLHRWRGERVEEARRVDADGKCAELR